MSDGTLGGIPQTHCVDGKTVILTEAKRFELGILQYLKDLKAYAYSLSREPEAAEDLVQDTVLRALSNRDKFDSKTNLRAWLFTILRNQFLTRMRQASREVELSDGVENGLILSQSGAQEDALLLKDVTEGIEKLPQTQKNALILVGALGYSVQEVSEREKCPPGTVKSRVSRGRKALLAYIE
jgi:RNA polymerase sigma-70 factor (ECF subfamily)